MADNITEDINSIPDVNQSKGLQRRRNRVEVVIHTMPKRFLQLPSEGSKKSKNVGLYIILGGSFVLVLVLAALYFYLSKTPESNVAINENRAPLVNNTATDQEVTKVVPDKNVNKQPSPVSNIPATSSEQTTVDEEDVPNSQDPGNTTTIIDANDIDVNEATDSQDVIYTEPENIEPVILKEAVDTDSDGLSDIEEVLLDSNPQAKDSDGDGYDDLAELVKLYNPAGSGKIIVNPNIEKFTNSELNYAMYYPKSWIVNNALGNSSVVFQLGGDEFIQVLVEPKFEEANLDEWYKKQFEVDFIENNKKIFKTGWAGIKNDDNLIAYLYNPNYDYMVIVTYSPGNDILKYQNIFEMMYSSFEFTN